MIVAMILYDKGGPDNPQTTLSEIFWAYNSYSDEVGVVKMRSTEEVYTHMEELKNYSLATGGPQCYGFYRGKKPVVNFTNSYDLVC